MKTLAFAIILLALTAIAMTAAPPAIAEAKTITVPDDYSTIAAAIGNATQGDTVFVRAGTYHERLIIDKALTLQGEDKASTVINGDNKGTVVQIRHDNVNFQGFTVKYNETPNTPKSLWMWSTRLIGIHLLSVKNCNVSDNAVWDCGGGIWLYDSAQNTVADNEVTRCDYGIRIESSSSSSLSGNSVTGNWGGLWLISASSIEFRNNEMTSNTQNFGISGSEASHFTNDLDSSNTVDGKPIYYWVNRAGDAVPSDAGCIVLVNCENIEISGLQLSRNKDGIVLYCTRNAVITDNTITDCSSGIETYSTLSDNIERNNINAATGISVRGNGTKIRSNIINATSVGITVEGFYQTVLDNRVEAKQMQSYSIRINGSYTNITRNRQEGASYVYATIDGDSNVFYENTMVDAYELRVSGDENIIARNQVTGITISEGTGNKVCSNRITNGLGLGIGGKVNFYYANQIEDNYYVGASIIGGETISSSNIVYHNNFINNKKQVKNFGANLANFWDNGTEGNYWSDYVGTDADGDGIGDTPHLIRDEVFSQSQGGMVQAVVGQDNYPLMTPFNINSVTVTLPEWNYVIPEPSATPTPTPTTSPSPSATPTPTPTSTTTAAPSKTPTTASASPTSPSPVPADTGNEPQPSAFPMTTILVIAGAATAIAVAAITIAVLRKRK